MMEQKTYPRLSTYGTTYIFGGRHRGGTLSLRNGQQSGSFSGYDQISEEALHRNYDLKYKACHGCVNHCRSWLEVKDGPYAGLRDLRIELAVQQAWGSLNDNAYAPSLLKGFQLCNQYGLDVVECGQLIAAATEWREMGLISDEDLGGTDLRWGNYDAMIELTHKIARREGIGDLLAEDALRAARKLGGGAEKCITHCKGALKTNADLRAMPVYAFGHAVSTRGADHLRGGALPNSGPPTKYEGVPRTVVENNYTPTIADSLELCKFSTTHSRMSVTVKQMTEMFALATGIEVDETEMRRTADRIWNLERAFIVREGIGRKDDVLVGRYMDEPLNGGPWDGFRYDRQKWEEMLDEYYELVGWDKATGVPTRTTLEGLGLKDVADELERMGRLPAEEAKI